MEEEVQGAPAESLTATDVEQVSSPAAPVEATTQEAVQEKPEVPFHEHPRWIELQEEKKWLRQQLEAANARSVVSPQSQPANDPYAGMTKEERDFYQRIEQIAEQKAQKIVAEKETLVRKELDETRQILATVAYERFQSKHPDVLPNSPEETAIANLYSRGYSLDDAYKVAMFDKIQQGKVTAAQVKSKETIQKKVAANVETSTISPSSGLPAGKKRSIREFVEDKISKGEF